MQVVSTNGIIYKSTLVYRNGMWRCFWATRDRKFWWDWNVKGHTPREAYLKFHGLQAIKEV